MSFEKGGTVAKKRRKKKKHRLSGVHMQRRAEEAREFKKSDDAMSWLCRRNPRANRNAIGAGEAWNSSSVLEV